MNTVNEIINSIETLLKSHTGYKISKDSGVPYQTVQDLKNGKTHIEDARFRIIAKLYQYQKSLEV
ncbi:MULTISPECIES: hypothetical protein [Staphylococcus]|jgi:hypothetical protein|uniref:hypothetical protein n=1 Tax=Staphylococcus TaxID=1279 RepID=UPI00026BFB8F|nr:MULTISPECIES: hypothetical protein [Staphylococcus]EJD81839.1 hypothetical protein HMPREF9994_02304 [Staphylococcus epidermidis NIHLM088]EJD88537.1 hypothetical protein HMPREF9992_02222 [Staphylococcus epidermidis NIHLM070]DAT89562.1 MAG TPA: DNA-binding protein [Caudoviricetes sp.]EJE23151.1 hypothetical protein HMPREF9976_05916 [Staphylococcus epidermidis NIHLM003]KPH57198.1 hypothetical protein ADT70_10760 [Staphylococcus epidermidis]